MLFRQRREPGRLQRLKLLLWPRVSWRRSALYYVKRTLRLSGTPHAIALGTGIGIFAAFTPLLGFHIVMTVALAWVLRANMIAGALATSIGNPLTLPLIWAATYEVGHWMLDGRRLDAPAELGHELARKSLEELLPLIKPMLVGSIPLGLAAGCVGYVLVYKAVGASQQARRKRIAALKHAADEAPQGPTISMHGQRQ